MSNHKTRTRHYQGFSITLTYNSAECGWWYSITNDSTGMDYGAFPDTGDYKEMLYEAQRMVNDIIAENKAFLGEVYEEEL